MKYPFRLDNVFFAELEFKRPPQMPDHFEIQVGVQVKVIDRDFPQKLEVQLKVQTDENSPLEAEILAIGLFNLVDGEPEPDRSIIPDFVSDRAFYILWAHVDQVLTLNTTKMGMEPVHLQWPIDFPYKPAPKLI